MLELVFAGTGLPVTVNHELRVVTGCMENGSYTLSLQAESQYTIYVDDVELALLAGQRNQWKWTAGFFAGRVAMDVVDGRGIVCESWQIDVSPAANKLGREEFEAMAEEIFAFNPALLFGDESAQASIGTQGDQHSASLAYARLRLYLPDFLKVLKRIQARPQMRLELRRESLPLHRARNVDAATVRTAALHGPSARLLGRSTASFDANTLFNVPSTRSTVDNPSNRTLMALLESALRKVRAVKLTFQTAESAPEGRHATAETKAPLPRRIDWLASIERELLLVLQGSLFSKVTRAEVSSAGLTTISAHPDYARAYRMGWQALRPGIEGPRSDERLWMSPTWEVFERWAFLQVTKCVQEVVPCIDPTITYPTTREDHVRFSASIEGGVLDVWLQARFPAYDQEHRWGFRSISGERFPDIIVTVERGEQRKFLVFDAKYRVSRPGVLEGMDSAHRYRDSLRWHDRPPDGAYLLIPAPSAVPWLEDEGFQQKQRVGAIALRKDNRCDLLAKVVVALLTR